MSAVATKAASQPEPADAGFWLRVGAKLMDHAIFGVLEALLVGVGACLNAFGSPPWIIGSGFVVSTVCWYIYIFELTRRRGQTVGKMAANVRVIAPDGLPPRAPLMLKRLAAEFVFDMLPVLGMAIGWLVARSLGLNQAHGAIAGAAVGAALSALDPLYVAYSPRRQAIHDKLAGTFVVRLAETRVKGFVVLAVLGGILPEATTFGIVRPFFVEAYFVPSGSMEPTIEIGDRILANKLVHRLEPPRHYQILMFQAPEWVSEEEKIFVKRVVGLPGDRLQVKEGKLWRNGQAVAEPYIKEPPDYTWPPDAEEGEEVVVPQGSVVVLGDNRNNSNDSHHWTRKSETGLVYEPAPFLPIDTIRGKLVYRYWPPSRMGTVAQEEWEGR